MTDNPDPDEKKARDIKVTDRRMFTPEGELREGFRESGSGAGGEAGEGTTAPVEPPREERAPPPGPVAGPDPGAPAGGPGGPFGGPFDEPGAAPGAPSLLDLVAVLAEPVPLYLGDAALPDGRRVEDLEAARFHIDLLDVLRQKTAGNVTAQEAAVMEDLLYRLRMRYVQKRG